MNIEDPNRTRKAFEWTKMHFAETYPGLQLKMVAHGDAKGSKEAAERG